MWLPASYLISQLVKPGGLRMTQWTVMKGFVSQSDLCANVCVQRLKPLPLPKVKFEKVRCTRPPL